MKGMAMKLSVKFYGCTRPRVDRIRMETEFRDAMLSYCPSVERLSRWQEKGHYEYMQARQRGYWAIYPMLTDKEKDKLVYMVTIK